MPLLTFLFVLPDQICLKVEALAPVLAAGVVSLGFHFYIFILWKTILECGCGICETFIPIIKINFGSYHIIHFGRGWDILSVLRIEIRKLYIRIRFNRPRWRRFIKNMCFDSVLG